MVLIGKKFHRPTEEAIAAPKKPKAKPQKEKPKETEDYPPNYKTTLCTRWESGHCEYGSR
jgi:hypothetical protein